MSLAVTRIVHSCLLLDFDGSVVLTDPWFTEKTGYRRTEPLGMEAADLPKLAGVFASHKHFDHFDLAALSAYPDKTVPFAVKTGMGKAARKAGFENVMELEPWQSAELGEVTVTAAPASHAAPEITAVFSAKGKHVFFGGDTLFTPELGEVARRFPSLDLALLPVNGLVIRPLGKKVVMDGADAAGLCGVLNPRVAVPIHYGHSAGGFLDSVLLKAENEVEQFTRTAATLAPDTRVKVLSPGERFTMPEK
ncbi:MAG: MBL fold metallo-hydrolase [Deltaproteobacteria bacterium]|nr:MBL fold metallo-hydrolase [Deltaproteobacteria bacterium]